jgi:hypothetical protein
VLITTRQDSPSSFSHGTPSPCIGSSSSCRPASSSAWPPPSPSPPSSPAPTAPVICSFWPCPCMRVPAAVTAPHSSQSSPGLSCRKHSLGVLLSTRRPSSNKKAIGAPLQHWPPAEKCGFEHGHTAAYARKGIGSRYQCRYHEGRQKSVGQEARRRVTSSSSRVAIDAGLQDQEMCEHKSKCLWHESQRESRLCTFNMDLLSPVSIAGRLILLPAVSPPTLPTVN